MVEVAQEAVQRDKATGTAALGMMEGVAMAEEREEGKEAVGWGGGVSVEGREEARGVVQAVAMEVVTGAVAMAVEATAP
jgi:hypothetical protein